MHPRKTLTQLLIWEECEAWAEWAVCEGCIRNNAGIKQSSLRGGLFFIDFLMKIIIINTWKNSNHPKTVSITNTQNDSSSLLWHCWLFSSDQKSYMIEKMLVVLKKGDLSIQVSDDE